MMSPDGVLKPTLCTCPASILQDRSYLLTLSCSATTEYPEQHFISAINSSVAAWQPNALLHYLYSVASVGKPNFSSAPPGAIMRNLSTLFAATFAAAFVLSSLAISAATPSARSARRER
jgi:hypothetical protein